MQATPAPASGLTYSRWVVTLHYGLNGLVLSTWFSRVPSVADRLDISTATLGIATLAMSLSAVAAIPPTARLLVLAGSARTVRWATPLSAVALLLAASSTALWSLLVTLCLLGISVGVQGASLNAHGATVARLANRTWMPSMIGAFSLAGMVGGLGGGVAARLHAGLVPHVLLVSALCFVAAVVVRAPDLPMADDTSAESTVTEAASEACSTTDPRTTHRRSISAAFFTIGLAAGISEGALASFAVVYFRDVLASTAWLASVSLTVLSAAIALVRLNGERLSDRFGVLQTLIVGGAATAAAGAVLVGGLSIPVSFGALIVAGLGVGCGIPLAFQLASAYAHESITGPGQERVVARTISNVSLACAGGYLSGGAVTGLLASLVGLRLALGLVVVGGLLITGAAAVLTVKAEPLAFRRRRPNSEPVPTPTPTT